MELGDDDTSPMDLAELAEDDPTDTDLTAATGTTTRVTMDPAEPATAHDLPPLPLIAPSPVRRAHLAPPPRRRRRAARAATMILVMLAVGGTGVLAGRLFAASAPAVSAPPAASSPNSGGGLGATPSPVTTIGGRTRPADALATWAGRVSQATGMPLVAAQAYGHAQLVLATDAPQCHLGWTTLAGIGEAASRHGQAYGASLGADGRSSRPSIGSPLDEAGRPRPDTDTGRLDGDPTADRPVGPMQLLPTQWNRYASDGDLDGASDPYDIDDASLATARLLCDSGADLSQPDLSQPEQWSAAVTRIRADRGFSRAVFDAADGYGAQTGPVG